MAMPIQLFFTCRSPKKQHCRAAGNCANGRDGWLLQWRIDVMPKKRFNILSHHAANKPNDYYFH